MIRADQRLRNSGGGWETQVPRFGRNDMDIFSSSLKRKARLNGAPGAQTKDSFHIEDQLVDGEKVVTRMTAHVQIRETGEPVTLLGINIARIVGGKLVEEWNTWEQTKATQKLNPSALSA